MPVNPQRDPSSLADRGAWERKSPNGQHMPLRHEALLTLARKVQAAAEDGDIHRLEHAASYLLDELALHVLDERTALVALAPNEERMLARGQAHLVSDAAALAEAISTGCAGQTEQCVDRAEDLVARLYLQAHDERLAFCDPAA